MNESKLDKITTYDILEIDGLEDNSNWYKTLAKTIFEFFYNTKEH